MRNAHVPAEDMLSVLDVQMEGVEGYFDHKDVPGDNMMGPVVHDEEVFASRKVTCVGQACPLYSLVGMQAAACGLSLPVTGSLLAACEAWTIGTNEQQRLSMA